MNQTGSNNTKTQSTSGYFVTLGEEETESIKGAKTINTGRLGIHYRKPDLISTLNANPALKGKKMHIVEISVPAHAITSKSDSKKFGMKGGNEVPIISIQPFKHKSEEVKKTAVA